MRVLPTHPSCFPGAALKAVLPGLWLLVAAAAGGAPLPPVEKLLPDDTLVLLSTPDVACVRSVWANSPWGKFWEAGPTRPFREKFIDRWRQELEEPLEREFGIGLSNCTALVSGQATIAVTRNGWQGDESEPLGLLLLLECGANRQDLTNLLASLRGKWAEKGKAVRTEKLHGYDFTVLPVGTNDLPRLLRQFFPRVLRVQELAADNAAAKPPPAPELIIGQADSLLVAGNSVAAVEKVLVRLTGGSLPCLADQAAYAADHQRLFREAPVYAWANFKAFLDVAAAQAARQPPAPPLVPADDITLQKLLTSGGFAGLRTISFRMHHGPEGLLWEIFLNAPESARKGLFRVITGEGREWAVPAFVPADVVRFERWRIDGQKAAEALRQMLASLTPQSLNGLKTVLNTAHDAAKVKDAAFDLRATLPACLGDDLITCEKTPRDSSPAELDSPPSLTLIGSPQPDRLAVCLKWLMVVLSDTPAEREFLGRKIYSAPLPPLPLLVSEVVRSGPQRTLSFAATSSYVALSTDAALLEEHLRSAESPPRPLRVRPGLVEAAQRVAGPGATLFGFVNRVQDYKPDYEALRADPAATNSAPLLGPWAALVGIVGPEKNWQEWLDFSLLPPFERVAPLFHFSVYGLTANVEGVSFRMFSPAPPVPRETAAK